MRTELIQRMTAVLNTATAFTSQGFGVTANLPWDQGGNPLYLKNMKTIYFSADRTEQTTLIPVIYGSDVYRTDLICDAYLAVDAKSQPSQLDNLVQTVLALKSQTGINNFGVESDYTVETQEDVAIYTFEFRMNTITT
jgi:hypothetical protein